MAQHVLLADECTQVLVSEQTAILSISWEVRNPSKKCTNGTLERRVAAWATRAKSWASCTEDAASIAQPVERIAMTSLWSPKIERAWVATVRAATWITAERQLAGDLEHVRHHEQQALRGGERRGQRSLLKGAMQRSGSSRL